MIKNLHLYVNFGDMPGRFKGIAGFDLHMMSDSLLIPRGLLLVSGYQSRKDLVTLSIFNELAEEKKFKDPLFEEVEINFGFTEGKRLISLTGPSMLNRKPNDYKNISFEYANDKGGLATNIPAKITLQPFDIKLPKIEYEVILDESRRPLVKKNIIRTLAIGKDGKKITIELSPRESKVFLERYNFNRVYQAIKDQSADFFGEKPKKK